MTLQDHLSELRYRLIFCFVVLATAGAVSWFFKEKILEIIARPVLPYLNLSQGQLIFTAPMDQFLAYIKISVFSAFVVSFPVIAFHIWKFLVPGLYKKEKLLILSFSFFGGLLFFLGVSFIYFIVYPVSFQFLMGMGGASAFISIKEYLSFFIQTSLAFGILFETPLVVVGLALMGVVTVDQLKKMRRYALVLAAVFSAIVTPPDVLSMLFLLIPLYLLYELSILCAGLFTKNHSKGEQ